MTCLRDEENPNKYAKIENDTSNIKKEDNNDIINFSNPTSELKSTLLNADEARKYKFRYFYPILLTINACLCSFYVGYNLGVFDTMQANLTVIFEWNDDNSDIYISIISSSVLFGGVFGSLTSGPILRIHGRRTSFFIYNLISVVGLILSTILNEYIIILGRILVGISAGAYSSLIAIYVNEYVPYEISGACGVSIEMTYALGICISYVIGFGLPKPEDQTHDNCWWRVMFLFPICFVITNQLMLMFYFNCDTPKYLVLKNKKEIAFNVLKEIYIHEADIKYLIQNIEALEESNSGGSVSFRQLLSLPYRKRFFIGVISCWGQQSNGIDTLIFYSNKIFYKNINSYWATVLTNILGFALFFSNILTIFVIERFGRRFILILGNLISLICLISICTLYYFDLFLPIVILFIIFVFVTGLTVAPVSYVYSSDILPESGMGLAVMFNYITTIIVIQTFPFLIKSSLNITGSLAIFAFTNFFMLLIVTYFFKETKGKSPKEIENLFK